MAGVEGLEPPTHGLEIRCSIRLSYTPPRAWLAAFGGISPNASSGRSFLHNIACGQVSRDGSRSVVGAQTVAAIPRLRDRHLAASSRLSMKLWSVDFSVAREAVFRLSAGASGDYFHWSPPPAGISCSSVGCWQQTQSPASSASMLQTLQK